MVFSLYCPAEMIFCVFYFVLFFNHCISVFVLLCFIFCALLVILPLLLVIMGGQHDGLLLSGSPPYLSHLYIYMYIFSWQINSDASCTLSFFRCYGVIIQRPFYVARQCKQQYWLLEMNGFRISSFCSTFWPKITTICSNSLKLYTKLADLFPDTELLISVSNCTCFSFCFFIESWAHRDYFPHSTLCSEKNIHFCFLA